MKTSRMPPFILTGRTLCSVGVLDIFFLNFNKGSTILDFAKIFCCHLSPVFIMWARIGEMLKLAYGAYQFFFKYVTTTDSNGAR
jgi:hypothetical protein